MFTRINNTANHIMVICMIALIITSGLVIFGIGKLDAKPHHRQVPPPVKYEQDVDISEITIALIEAEVRKQEKLKREHANAIEIAKQGIDEYTDLGTKLALTGEDMNKIIDEWTSHLDNSVIRGHGDAYIEASKRTGLNPIYLLAHSIIESGSGTSYLARTRGNFFGINAVDSNPDLAYHMGDTVDEGIISGAEWIKRNYYDNGYKTLRAMKDANYATSDRWVRDIVSVANTTVGYL